MISPCIGQERKFGKFHVVQRSATQHIFIRMREQLSRDLESPVALSFAGGLVVEYHKPWCPDEGLDGHRPEK